MCEAFCVDFSLKKPCPSYLVLHPMDGLAVALQPLHLSSTLIMQSDVFIDR